MNLRELDRVWVPRMAAHVGAWARSVLVRRDKAAEILQSVDADTLKRLDDRCTRSGPLATLRELPQLAFVVIAVLFAVGLASAGRLEADRQRQQQAASESPDLVPSEQVQPAEGTVLGPDVGMTTGEYEATALQSVQQAAKDGPDAVRVALVSLSAYRTPAQTVQLFEGLDVQRVFLRARAAGKEAAQLPIDIKSQLAAELTKAYQTTAKGRREAQKAYQGYVDTLTVTTKEEQAFKDLYVAFATSTRIEAEQYSKGCACVFAVVVKASAKQLVRLAGQPGVRAVQAADKGQTLSVLQVRPLLPEVKGVVPKQQAATDVQP